MTDKFLKKDDDDAPKKKRTDDDPIGKGIATLKREQNDSASAQNRSNLLGQLKEDDDDSPRKNDKERGITAAIASALTASTFTPDPEIAAKLAPLETRYRDLVNSVNLTDESSSLTSLKTQLDGFEGTIDSLRKRGYVFRSYLENKVRVLNQQLTDTQSQIERFRQQETNRLHNDLKDIDRYVTQIRTRANGSAITPLTGALDDLQAQLDSLTNPIQTLLSALQAETSRTNQQIHEMTYCLEQKDEAKFQFVDGESVYVAANAEWDDGRDKPEGVLFVTDQRLIFEQKENIGGGLFRRGEFTQQILWELPLNTIKTVTPEDKGIFGGKDIVKLEMQAGARHPQLVVEIKGGIDSKYFAQQIQHMVRDGGQNERAVPPNHELIEALREAPTQCHICGATLPVVMVGQTQINCTYCGAVFRL